MKMELLSRNISNYLKNELDLDEDKRSIIEYGIFSFLHIFISVISIAIIGLGFNVIIESLIISLIIDILRKFSGGAHASTAINCTIFGVVICVIPAYIIKRVIISINYMIIIGVLLYIISFIIIYKLAPVDSPNKPIKKKEKIKRLKRGSIIILSIYMILVIINISFYYFNHVDSLLTYSACIYVGILWQVFTLTRYGHIIVNKIDSLLINIINIIGGKKDEEVKQ